MNLMKNVCLTLLAGSFLAFGVAGCRGWSVGPDYKEPEIQAAAVPLPDAGYPTTNKTETGEFKAAAAKDDPRKVITAESIRSWWNQFNDDILTNLVEAAVSNNLTFLMAQQRLLQARWQLVGSAAAFLPKVSLDGSYTRSGAHKFTSSRWGSGKNFHGDHWKSGFDATWEIDIFGGTRRAFESAEAAMDAANWSLADAWVSLTSEIGSQYISLRTVQERLRVARANLKLQSETYDILKSRLDSGIGDELAVNQAKYNVEQTRASIPNLLVQEEKLMNVLAILTGTMPGALHPLLRDLPERDWLVAPQRLADIPLDTIRLRPDVKSAERALASQVAAVGVATSHLFPKFYINGTFGGGNLVANMKVAEAKMDEAALKYELAVQTAFEEARNAYSAYTQEHHRYQSLQGAVKAARSAVDISNDLYKNGLADFNNVLDAQRSLLTLEEALTISRGNISIDLIALYKALGGGITAED